MSSKSTAVLCPGRGQLRPQTFFKASRPGHQAPPQSREQAQAFSCFPGTAGAHSPNHSGQSPQGQQPAQGGPFDQEGARARIQSCGRSHSSGRAASGVSQPCPTPRGDDAGFRSPDKTPRRPSRGGRRLRPRTSPAVHRSLRFPGTALALSRDWNSRRRVGDRLVGREGIPRTRASAEPIRHPPRDWKWRRGRLPSRRGSIWSFP